uniref:Uncharacterized protein n=1 Tax=Setaria digitata TaxID=48799 RepID=A0A915Q7E8_9BILA
MIWTEKEQKRRRQAGVKEYVRKLQQLHVTDHKRETED